MEKESFVMRSDYGGLLTKRLAKIRHKIVLPYLKGDVLDIGCGDAQIFEARGTKILSYCGIEQSNALIAGLSKKYPKADFIERDLDHDLIALNKKFDCILMIAVIEHIFNQKFVMGQVASLLKPEGNVVITTPTYWGNDIIHPIGVFLGLFSKPAFYDHIVIYNRHRLNIMAKEVGLKLKHYSKFLLFCNQIAILEKV